MLWADTTRPPQPNWGVAVEGDCIVTVGPHADLRARFPGAAVVEAADCVITPAFVNTHHHMYGVLAHGIPTPPIPPSERGGPGGGTRPGGRRRYSGTTNDGRRVEYPP